MNLSPKNNSPELKLERAIINACGENWSNQIPVASGLVGRNADRRVAIDLVHSFDLTELASALNNAVGKFGVQNDIALHFEFCELGADYAEDPESECVRSAINERGRVWASD